MKYNIIALSNNQIVFNGATCFVPRKGEQLEVRGVLYVVDYVKYKIQEGTSFNTFVELGLRIMR